MGIINRPDTAEKMSELENKAVRAIQTEIQRAERDWKKLSITSVPYRAVTRAYCMSSWDPRGKHRRNSSREVSISDKTINPQTQKAQQTPSRIR